MTLIDLKNYRVAIDYSNKTDRDYQIVKVDEKCQITFGAPTVTIEYEFDGKIYKSGWVGKRILKQNMEIESYTVEYKMYFYGKDNVIDTVRIDYSSPQQPITKEYSTTTRFTPSVSRTLVDYAIKFDTRVYLPHIFVIVCCLFFIIPSVVMLFKIRQEEK